MTPNCRCRIGVASAAAILLALSAFPEQNRAHAVSDPPSRHSLPASEVAERLDELEAAAGGRIQLTNQEQVQIGHIVEQMPPATRIEALQAEAQLLNQELERVGDPAEADRINLRLTEIAAELEREMENDPLRRRVERLQTPEMATPHSKGVAFNRLERGDIILIRHKLQPVQNFLWAKWYAHIGVYDGGGRVMESNVTTGVRLHPLSDWRKPGDYVALARSRSASPERIHQAMDWAKAFYGVDGRTPYNFWFVNKQIDSRLYCSQLVWKIYRRAGADVDSNDARFMTWLRTRWGPFAPGSIGVPAVAPDEIRASPHVGLYSEGWNGA